MTVYVDDMNAAYRDMVMCHMIADTDEELHAMADAIGMQRRWHQAPPKHQSHYDVPQDRKALAIELGAIAISYRECGAMTYRRRITGQLGPREEAFDWFHAHRALRAAARRNDVGA